MKSSPPTPELPALPETSLLHFNGGNGSVPVYTAAQMHAYAQATLAAARGQEGEDAARLAADRRLVAAAVEARDTGGKVHPWEVFVWAESVRPGLWREKYGEPCKEKDHAR